MGNGEIPKATTPEQKAFEVLSGFFQPKENLAGTRHIAEDLSTSLTVLKDGTLIGATKKTNKINIEVFHVKKPGLKIEFCLGSEGLESLRITSTALKIGDSVIKLKWKPIKMHIDDISDFEEKAKFRREGVTLVDWLVKMTNEDVYSSPPISKIPIPIE
ncbi:MAG: hypothetical protein ABH816_01880 [Candidatus Levyibacteriota bacterium]